MNKLTPILATFWTTTLLFTGVIAGAVAFTDIELQPDERIAVAEQREQEKIKQAEREAKAQAAAAEREAEQAEAEATAKREAEITETTAKIRSAIATNYAQYETFDFDQINPGFGTAKATPEETVTNLTTWFKKYDAEIKDYATFRIVNGVFHETTSPLIGSAITITTPKNNGADTQITFANSDQTCHLTLPALTHTCEPTPTGTEVTE